MLVKILIKSEIFWKSNNKNFLQLLVHSYNRYVIFKYFLKYTLFFQFFQFYFIFQHYNIVLVLPNIEMNPPQVYMCSPSWTLLPPHTLPLGRPIAPAPSIQYPALNLDWQLISYMIYMLQCHSPKSSHPLSLPQSP